MKIRFICENSGKDEYILIDNKRYTCLKKAKDRIRRRASNSKAYAEAMEYLAFQVFAEGSVENNGLFADTRDLQLEDELYSYFAYLGPFWFIGLMSGSRNRELRFHLNQGIVLFITEICGVVSVYCINRLLGSLDGILGIIALWLGRLLWLGIIALFFWLSVTGMLNVAKAEKRPLPLIGGIKLLKATRKSSNSRKPSSSGTPTNAGKASNSGKKPTQSKASNQHKPAGTGKASTTRKPSGSKNAAGSKKPRSKE